MARRDDPRLVIAHAGTTGDQHRVCGNLGGGLAAVWICRSTRGTKPKLSNVEPCMDEELSTQIDARRDIERVRAAFMSLSEKVRGAFVLCELEGFSAKEAGQVLGTNEVTIWKRVSDARKALVRA